MLSNVLLKPDLQEILTLPISTEHSSISLVSGTNKNWSARTGNYFHKKTSQSVT